MIPENTCWLEASKDKEVRKMFDKAKDPVCGMKISKKTAAATSDYMDKTVYFCAQGCKNKFDENPLKYMKTEERKGGCCG